MISWKLKPSAGVPAFSQGCPKISLYQTGFYGSYLDLDNPYRSAFFTNLGVKSRRQLNFLGTILEEQGMVSRETLQEVIRDYNNIKKKRIGETIAQKAQSEPGKN